VVTDVPDPAVPAPPPPQGAMSVRVADADRDRTVALLREHVVDGRLTLDEFSARVGLALQARTQGDLQSAMTDLPTLAEPQPAGSKRPVRRTFIGVLSGAQAKGRWRVGERTRAIAVMGGCDLDLRQAQIEGPEVVITAVAFWGGITIIVPEGFEVELEGFSFMGGRDLKLRNVPLVPGSPRIRIRGYSVMGGIDIRSRSSRSGRALAQSVADGLLGTPNALPSLDGDSSSPIDLEALGRDIRQQIRAQRHARHRGVAATGDEVVAPSNPPPPSPPAPAATPSAPTAPATPAAPMAPTVPGAGEGTVTILFSDMVNYAGMTEAMGDRASRELLQEHHRIVRTLVDQHGGREVKVQGDGFMMAFGGVARALRCAVEMQRAFEDYSLSHPDLPIQVHIGVHTGEVFEQGDDFLGHTVIVASRLADVAGPGEILVSSLSEQLVVRSGEFQFGDARQVTLKGLAIPQQAATLVWAG
jgi:class 3 adenylate cyclase